MFGGISTDSAMHVQIIFALILAASAAHGSPEQGAQYLQNTIKGLRNHMNLSNNRRAIQVVTTSPIKRAYTQESVPSLHLTKAELAALYETAVSKGETIKLDPGEGASQISAAVHQIDETNNAQKNGQEKDAGYYYYYYPLKSFVDEVSATVYNHEHNVHIENMKNTMDMDKKSKAMEPLFMAISGFIGMTIMFILSILVLPRFDKLKPKGFKNEGVEMTSITRVALEAIEGRDCTERLACEVGKAANAFNLYDNRFVKLVRRMGPRYLGKQIEKIGKYTDKKFKCASIQCKRKGGLGGPQKSKEKSKLNKR